LTTAMAEPDPALPPVKVFKPKHNLPVLLDYSHSAPVSFWEKLLRCESWPAKSRVKPTKIKGLALTLGCSDRDMLKVLCVDLSNGADIGCTGEYRKGSMSMSAASAMDFPWEITDGYATGSQRDLRLGR
jgi:hypothetical protein